ncbi:MULTISPECIES: glycoside hydrolase family 15 protein [Burkholderiaceae]|uniref:Glycoside hydrolase 15-related protein n=6 Tax=Cupriavidus TaxID=106589 RepID=A0A375CK20_9BURK|nr:MULTISPECIES: glycoside hydrolase family 15 protein [Burkholderiaceae]NOV26680.1 glycoside hydrolase family 15 protein [Cupriavidus necator]AMR78372.1 hypothetical protein A2G96_11845 [Cupriavidus nantongensis]KAA6117648.1 glycoside hydrolase family 15 protein [Cupriavidus cauae]KAB0595280.1 glycoside hydrolase family 15 protein [Cupriavidus gilardii]MBB0027175.1 glycoside hydrolase family 15 protein [Ralstonia pickettii]
MFTNPRYPPIADYAVIGNTHSVALVSTSGSIDWCCMPHFDAGAVFCRLLDANRGGYFQIRPTGRAISSRYYRVPGGVLETMFEASGGILRLTDFMHSERLARSRLDHDSPECHRLLRRIEATVGEVRVELVFSPSFDYARKPHQWEVGSHGVTAVCEHQRLSLVCSPPLPLATEAHRAKGVAIVRPGAPLWAIASFQQDGPDRPVHDPQAVLDETLRHWGEWQQQCTYRGPFEREVRTSACVLKLLTFGPTGALVAAPTTSLPEWIGSSRNWDYRFCWLRDSAMVLRALMALGHHEAAMDFFRWIERFCDLKRLQIMYRIDGSPNLPEQELRHLDGYRASRPVRIGNAAAEQVQLDVYGHVLDAAWVCQQGMPMTLSAPMRRVLARLADAAAARWREPDQGFWETRGVPQHFVSSKLMCWVALDRAIALAQAGQLDGNVAVWKLERDALRRVIEGQGFHHGTGAFTQSFGSPALDASALLIPLTGFLPPTDARVKATVARIQRDLTKDSLVYRYRIHDGVPGEEATLAICSFWLVQVLARQGRAKEAIKLFRHICSFASDLGLFAEEIDPDSKALLGNYPQGYTHLALIQAALDIQQAQQRGEA